MLDEVPCSQATVHEYAYDAEGKLISSAFGATRYIYDAEGNRVAKQNYLTGVITNQYLYDTAGRMTVEIDGSGNVLRQEIYAGNRYLGTLQNGTMYYSHANWLGTDSARSDSGGLLCQTSGSLPFGDALQVSGNCSPSTKFYTGKERDAESGLDYFGARYYGSNMGRWMSPDWSAQAEPVPYSVLDDPQSLNLYQFVRNNPLRNRDSDGHDCPPDCGDGLNDSMAGSPFEGITHTPLFQNVAKIGVGVGLMGTIATGDVPGSAAGAVITFNATLGATSSVVSGITGLMGQATNTNVKEAQEALSATSTAPGLVIATGGNLKAADAVSTVTNAASLATAPKEVLKNGATAADAAQTVNDTSGLVQRTINKVTNIINPGPPPAPKPPSPPGCSVAGACPK